METVFPYPGGKSYMASWIIDHFPEHHCYVEPFGGGASVMANKPPSNVEIYNDQDGDLVHFFRVLRESPQQLVEWLRARPFAKDLHEKYGRAFYAGYRPEDDIERAGRFFYLRRSQYAGKYPTFSGFMSARSRSKASEYQTAIDDLERFADRFREVTIENRDYGVIFERFDAEDTLFYCDPPYVDVGESLYTNDGFDHMVFCENLESLDGYWVVSYGEKIPEPLESYNVIHKDMAQMMNNGHEDRTTERVEKLILNYDSKQTPKFSEAQQETLV